MYRYPRYSNKESPLVRGDFLNISVHLAGVINLLSNNSEIALTPDGLRNLAVPSTPRATTAEPPTYQVHRLSARLGPEQVHEIVRRYEAGESATALASAYSIATSALLRLLRKQQVVVRRHNLTPEQDATLAQEYKAGVTMAELEEKFTLSHGAVYRALRRVGVQTRASGRRPRST